MIHVYFCQDCKIETELEIKSFKEKIPKYIKCKKCGKKIRKVFKPNSNIINFMLDKTTSN